MDDDDLEVQGTTRAEVEANLTQLINDELIGSVIEYDVDGEIYHCDVPADEDTYDWDDWDLGPIYGEQSLLIRHVRTSA